MKYLKTIIILLILFLVFNKVKEGFGYQWSGPPLSRKRLRDEFNAEYFEDGRTPGFLEWSWERWSPKDKGWFDQKHDPELYKYENKPFAD